MPHSVSGSKQSPLQIILAPVSRLNRTYSVPLGIAGFIGVLVASPHVLMAATEGKAWAVLIIVLIVNLVGTLGALVFRRYRKELSEGVGATTPGKAGFTRAKEPFPLQDGADLALLILFGLLSLMMVIAISSVFDLWR